MTSSEPCVRVRRLPGSFCKRSAIGGKSEPIRVRAALVMPLPAHFWLQLRTRMGHARDDDAGRYRKQVLRAPDGTVAARSYAVTHLATSEGKMLVIGQ